MRLTRRNLITLVIAGLAAFILLGFLWPIVAGPAPENDVRKEAYAQEQASLEKVAADPAGGAPERGALFTFPDSSWVAVISHNWSTTGFTLARDSEGRLYEAQYSVMKRMQWRENWQRRRDELRADGVGYPEDEPSPYPDVDGLLNAQDLSEARKYLQKLGLERVNVEDPTRRIWRDRRGRLRTY